MKRYKVGWISCILITALSFPVHAKNWNLTPEEKQQAAEKSKNSIVDSDSVRRNPLNGVDPPSIKFWDGTYSVVFKVNSKVCEKPLTIELSIMVEDLDFTGSIKNLSQRKEFTKNDYCTKYHSGSVRGSLNRDGTFATFDIKQFDETSEKVSSFKATGSMVEGALLSRNPHYHPQQSFSFVTTYEVTQALLNASTKSSPWFSNYDGDLQKTSQNVTPDQTMDQKRSSPFTKDKQTLPADRSVETSGSISLPQTSDPKLAIEEIDLKITLYAKIANNLPQTDAGYKIQQEVLDKKIQELKALRETLAASYLDKYNTPIYPVNMNLGTTAFRYAEIFPSIPYYIPGTREVGEFLVQPVVSDTGQLTYEFTFLDPSARYNKEREQIVVINTDMGSLINGLDKVREWTETAEEQNVRRRYEKVAICFPERDCGRREVGKSSTEVVFQIYEDGSTAGKLQRVKGEFVSGYNMSVESTVLLGAYLKYMRDIGEQEFKVGSMTEKDLDSIFE